MQPLSYLWGGSRHVNIAPIFHNIDVAVSCVIHSIIYPHTRVSSSSIFASSWDFPTSFLHHENFKGKFCKWSMGAHIPYFQLHTPQGSWNFVCSWCFGWMSSGALECFLWTVYKSYSEIHNNVCVSIYCILLYCV